MNVTYIVQGDQTAIKFICTRNGAAFNLTDASGLRLQLTAKNVENITSGLSVTNPGTGEITYIPGKMLPRGNYKAVLFLTKGGVQLAFPNTELLQFNVI